MKLKSNCMEIFTILSNSSFIPKIICSGDLILLEENISHRIHNLTDSDEIELFVNTIDILDQFDHGADINSEPFIDFNHKDFAEAWVIAMEIANKFKTYLTQKFPQMQFYIYAFKHDRPIVRFQRNRLNNNTYIKLNEFNDTIYTEDSLIIKTNPNIKIQYK